MGYSQGLTDRVNPPVDRVDPRSCQQDTGGWTAFRIAGQQCPAGVDGRQWSRGDEQWLLAEAEAVHGSDSPYPGGGPKGCNGSRTTGQHPDLQHDVQLPRRRDSYPDEEGCLQPRGVHQLQLGDAEGLLG